tara:strand:- start:273 stop:2087 length:1815 start_codon:yes stop_codon:yes gene_type:complete
MIILILVLMLNTLISVCFADFQNLEKKSIHASPTWKALLHYKNKKFFHKDKNFLLSYGSPDLLEELNLTINLFVKDPLAKCRFPARYIFLQRHLKERKLQNAGGSFKECKGFSTYLKKAPARNIQLVYAAQNILSSTSMMGHSFLKLSGKNDIGDEVSHSVNYFARIKTHNPLWLVSTSLFLGMEGVVFFKPYQKIIDRYRIEEKRNVWEIDLNLEPFKRTLIHYHIWELKNTKTDYFFIGYNCATFTHFLLALGHSKKIENGHWWITPGDVIKDAYAFGMINYTDLIASDHWLVKNFFPEIKEVKLEDIKKAFDKRTFKYIYSSKHFSEKEKLMALKILQGLNNIRYNEKKISQIDYEKFGKELINYEKKRPLILNLSKFTNPYKTPQDTQFSMSFIGGKDNKLGINFLYASTKLRDDNRQFLSERQLKLADFKLLYNFKDKKIELDTLTFFEALSLVPYDPLTKGLSFNVKTGIHKHYNSNLRPNLSFDVELASGLNFRLAKDIDLYAMLGLGTAISKDFYYLYMFPTFGMVIREVFDMKSLFNVRLDNNFLNDKSKILTLSFEQSFHLNPSHTLSLKIDSLKELEQNMQEVSFEFSHIYYF